MNERIKLLALQANPDFAKFYIVGPWHAEDIEKFAELIVRECCQFENSYGGDAGLVARSYSRKIREHFGVEE